MWSLVNKYEFLKDNDGTGDIVLMVTFFGIVNLIVILDQSKKSFHYNI